VQNLIKSQPQQFLAQLSRLKLELCIGKEGKYARDNAPADACGTFGVALPHPAATKIPETKDE
jgi:hypothetical protein